MQISIGKNNTSFKPVTVSKLEEFGKLTQEYNWSPGLYKDNYRNKENFISCECVGLDIDNDEDVKMSLEEAREAFKDYKHVIVPSKSHRKEKNGEVKDRYRVILFLSQPINDEPTYNATWQSLQNQFPAIDPACRDTSRFYYPSKAIVSSNMKGKPIDPVLPTEVRELEAAVDRAVLETAGVAPEEQQGGELSRKTLKFMQEGARPGQRHRELYKAARDYHQNNRTKEQFMADLAVMITRTGKWATKKPSSKDISTVDDAFRTDPKHDARIPYEKALFFKPVSEVLNSEEKFEWLCDRFLSVGGISIIAGDPKAGKSTLIRQLTKSVARGEDFLGRPTKQGTVFCMSLEEQEGLLKSQFKALGVTDKDPIRIHVGSPDGDLANVLLTLEDELDREKVALLVIDTFQLGLGINDLFNYTEVTKAIQPFRDLARNTGCHILMIHHTSKAGIGFNAISGSKAIFGAVDTAMIMKSVGKKRIFSCIGRGIRPVSESLLIYNEKQMTYTLGPEGGFDEDDSF